MKNFIIGVILMAAAMFLIILILGVDTATLNFWHLFGVGGVVAVYSMLNQSELF